MVFPVFLSRRVDWSDWQATPTTRQLEETREKDDGNLASVEIICLRMVFCMLAYVNSLPAAWSALCQGGPS